MHESIAILLESRDWVEAQKLSREQLFNRNDPYLYCQLVKAFEDNGMLSEARLGLEELVSVYPERVSFLLEYARLLVYCDLHERAIRVWEKVLKLSPDSRTALFNLAKVYCDTGQQEKAIALYEELLQVSPDHENALFNLANLKQRLGDFESAVAFYKKLLVLNPLRIDVWINIGKAYKSLEFYSKAEFCYRRALELDAENVVAHWNLAHVLLSQERWGEGWAEYEWRLQRSAAFFPPGLKGVPCWQGEDLSEKRILLWVEQGAGDAIQFVRFISLLPGPPKQVVIYCPPSLVRLLATAPGVDYVASYEQVRPLVDCHLSLLSLPWRLGLLTSAEVCAKPYLWPVSDRVAEESDAYFGDGGLKVGLVWAGNARHANDANRSMTIRDFAGLIKTERLEVSFFSLQVYGGGQNRKSAVEISPNIIDLAPYLSDFADTAKWLCKLDLLITVDTAVAHLAGALGRPAWVLLPKKADWRWSLNGSESLWYPSLRLFRQSQAGEWGSVIEEIKRELMIFR